MLHRENSFSDTHQEHGPPSYIALTAVSSPQPNQNQRSCPSTYRRVTMGLMAKEYVNHSEGGYRIADTRVSLDSLVYLFREGMS